MPLSSSSIWQILQRGQFCIICTLIKCIFFFSTEGWGIQQREWTLLICLCYSTMAENTRNGNQKSHRERKFKCVPKRVTALQQRAALLCMHSSERTSGKTRKDTQRSADLGHAWYITTSCKIKVSLFWAFHTHLCIQYWPSHDRVHVVLDHEGVFFFRKYGRVSSKPEGCHKNKWCLWKLVVYNSSVRTNTYWLACSITLDMWMALGWNCHIFFFLAL